MMDIYEYFDYRKVLQDLYAERKKKNPHFSYRFICQRIGITSPGYFSKVLHGQSNLSLKTVLKLCEIFKLKRHEAEYFELLVLFNQAKTQDEKRHLFTKILKIKKSKIKTLDESHFELFSHWYYSAIREILDFYLFKDNYAGLAEMVVPAVSPNEAKRAVEVLENLGLVRKCPDGYYEKVEALISTGEILKSLAVRHFQSETLDLAKQAIERFPKDARDISTLTVSISKQGLDTIREKLKTVRGEILEFCKNETETDRVYQINFQVFPLSRFEERNKP